jgi:hypothetical protein
MNYTFRARISFSDVTIVDLLVSSLGGNRYRLEEFPLLADSVFFRDVIEAERQANGSLLFTKVAERSGMQNHQLQSNTIRSST